MHLPSPKACGAIVPKYSDQVKRIKDKYPNVMFVVVGSGNEGLGGNTYWVYMRNHEAAYLQGVTAGLTTKTGTVGFVGTFPADDVVDAANAYFAGAASVKPDIHKKVAFIESWWDPPMAREASTAQIAAGADNLLMSATAFEGQYGEEVVHHGRGRHRCGAERRLAGRGENQGRSGASGHSLRQTGGAVERGDAEVRLSVVSPGHPGPKAQTAQRKPRRLPI